MFNYGRLLAVLNNGQFIMEENFEYLTQELGKAKYKGLECSFIYDAASGIGKTIELPNEYKVRKIKCDSFDVADFVCVISVVYNGKSFTRFIGKKMYENSEVVCEQQSDFINEVIQTLLRTRDMSYFIIASVSYECLTNGFYETKEPKDILCDEYEAIRKEDGGVFIKLRDYRTKRLGICYEEFELSANTFRLRWAFENNVKVDALFPSIYDQRRINEQLTIKE